MTKTKHNHIMADSIKEDGKSGSLHKQVPKGAAGRAKDIKWKKVAEGYTGSLADASGFPDSKLVEQVVEAIFPKGAKVVFNARKTPAKDRYHVISLGQRPRWIVPKGTSFSQRQVIYRYLSQRRPHRQSFNFMWKGVYFAYLLGFLQYLPNVKSIGIFSPLALVLKGKTVSNGAPMLPVIHIGIKNISKKATVGLVDTERLKMAAVSKYALERNARLTNKIEAAMLAQLGKEIPGVAPRLFYADPEGALIIQEAIKGKRPSRNFRNRQIDFLKKLKRPGRTTTLEKVAKALRAQIKDLESEEKEILEAAVKRVFDATRIPVVWVHGDFFLANQLVTEKGELIAFDWEFANPDGLPLYDIVDCLCFRKIGYERKIPLKERIKTLAPDYLDYFVIKEEFLDKLILACLVEDYLFNKKRQHEIRVDLLFGKIKETLEAMQ